MTAETTFVTETINTGYTQVPHGLWTLDVAQGTKLLLGWLHSHAPSYLAKLSVNRIEQEFGGGGSVRVWLAELRDRGFITQVKDGNRWVITLLAEPWLALHRKPRAVAPQPADSAPQENPPIRPPEPADPAPVVDHSEKTKDLDATVPTGPTRAADESPRKQRPRDELFDAMITVCGIEASEMTRTLHGQASKAVAELRKVGATPLEVYARADVYEANYPGNSLTPAALCKHWAMLRLAPKKAPQTAADAILQKVMERNAPPNVVPINRAASA